MPRMRKAPKTPPRGDIWHLRIVLREIDPPVWRRVLIRNTTTLAELHAILQDVMGSQNYQQNYHLWEFIIGRDRYEANGGAGLHQHPRGKSE